MEKQELNNKIAKLPERKRRTYHRKMERGDEEEALAILNNHVDDDEDWSDSQEDLFEE